MTTLLLIFSLFPHAEAAHRGPGVHQRTAMSALRRRCDGGNGESCYSYAKMLRLYGDKPERGQIAGLIRKACRMSYQPACAEPGPVRKARTHFK
jgi:hypothetical protein